MWNIKAMQRLILKGFDAEVRVCTGTLAGYSKRVICHRRLRSHHGIACTPYNCPTDKEDTAHETSRALHSGHSMVSREPCTRSFTRAFTIYFQVESLSYFVEQPKENLSKYDFYWD